MDFKFSEPRFIFGVHALRFTSDGPSIPNELLTLRDQGEVVFFCGAGISKPAGLPGFFELTKRIFAKLSVPPTSKAHKLMRPALEGDDPELAPPLDQVFGILQREYTSEKIEREVANLLKSPRSASVVNHSTILRLSCDANRDPFVVTTNFDLLFERAKRRVTRWSPPMLPSMIGDLMPSGIVYLHGRLPGARTTDVPALVLGSSDFGRAYLADGWATTFIRQLLERKVVVLLGYSASDPPIRYLLEGLDASTSARLRTIYAFDRGDDNEVRIKWRDLGVKAIPFKEFSHLWSSLESWAVRADDPDEWTNHVMSLAQQSPRQLRSFERGQVAALVATTEGAKAFANANTPPSAEWLCVFDKYARYGKPSRDRWGADAVEIDPLNEYGLDDDPPRPNPTSGREQIQGVDLIASLPEDNAIQSYTRLSGIQPEQINQNTRRLWVLSRWFESVAHQPSAIWWAGRQLHLHPDLLWGVNRRLAGHGNKFEDQVWRIWTLLYEINSSSTNDIHDLGWYDFVALLHRGGWTSGAFRAFEKAIRPRLAVEPRILRAPIPPTVTDSPEIEDLLELKVHVPSRHGSQIEIPDDVLPEVFGIVRGSLERAISLLKDATHQSCFFRLPAIEPDERPGHHHNPNEGIEANFLWAVSLFKRLCEKFPTQARLEVARWPQQDEYIFDKFKIYAWTQKEIIPASEAASGVLSLGQETFWNGYLQRELLHLLRARWEEFSALERNAIERRIVAGREKYPLESEKDYRTRSTFLAGGAPGLAGTKWLRLIQRDIAKTSYNQVTK
jgi:hypothetical protein